MTLGEQIKEAREKKNLSQEELAAMVGVSRQAVSKWENNTAVPHGINRETLTQVLELDLADVAPASKKAVVFAWIGWILAGALLIVIILFAVKLLPIFFESINDENLPPVEITSIDETPTIKSVRFFDSVPNEIEPDAGWYNTAKIESILISWTGGQADSIQMFVIPTGTETMSETKLLMTKMITDGESTALLSADALHSDNITTMHLYFEIHIGNEVIISDTYNIFYDANEIH